MLKQYNYCYNFLFKYYQELNNANKFCHRYIMLKFMILMLQCFKMFFNYHLFIEK